MAIATINPATGEIEKTFEPHDAAEVERRLTLAAVAFASLKGTTFAQRGEWMRSAAALLEAEVDPLAEIVTREMGRPIAGARAEVLKCAKGMRFYAEHAATFLADEPLDDPSKVGASRAVARYQPLGVILAVMPWNYPLWQVVRFAAPALMAGNTGVLKHASNVPQSALYLDSLFTRGGFPEGAFTTLLIGSAECSSSVAPTRSSSCRAPISARRSRRR
jgi:succinate-semialdehyde dehydrogenase/glutarate-semialdehyde dehydrogenase